MALKLSAWQRRALAVPDDVQLQVFAGGRAGGKSFCAVVAAIKYADKWGKRAKIMFVRRTAQALADISETITDVLTQAYGEDGFVRNRNLGEWRLNNGAIIRAEQYDFLTPQSRDRLQGASVGMMVFDEAPQFLESKLIFELMSNLRAPAGVPTRVIMTGNPGSPGSHWFRDLTEAQSTSDTIYVEKRSKLRMVWHFSTYADNEFLSEGYGAVLRASTSSDPALQGAWVDGSWERVRGAFYELWDPAVHIIEPWTTIPSGFQTRLSMDWGSSAPAAVLLTAVSLADAIGPDDRSYKKGSAIVLGEISTNLPGSLTSGDGSSPADVAQRVFDELLSPYNLRPQHVGVMAADPQIGVRASGRNSFTVASEFKDAGLRWRPASRENRVARLAQIRSLLSGSIAGGRPSLHLTTAAPMLIQTLPILQRSEHRQDDCAANSPKHWVDALSYGLASSAGGGKRVVQYDGYGARSRPAGYGSRAARLKDETGAVRV